MEAIQKHYQPEQEKNQKKEATLRNRLIQWRKQKKQIFELLKKKFGNREINYDHPTDLSILLPVLPCKHNPIFQILQLQTK